jgi:hypothetical protein
MPFHDFFEPFINHVMGKNIRKSWTGWRALWEESNYGK